MKFLLNIKLVLFALMSMITNAQNDYPKDGDNIKDFDLDKFVGTWVWEKGNDRLVLIIKKENVLLPIGQNIRADVLYGFHQYSKNGNVLENTLMYENTSYSDKKYTLFELGKKSGSDNIQLSFLPLERKYRTLYANVEYIDSKRIKIKNYEKKEVVRINNPLDDSRILPEDIILIRQ